MSEITDLAGLYSLNLAQLDPFVKMHLLNFQVVVHMCESITKLLQYFSFKVNIQNFNR